MRLTPALDARLDPVAAARGAARYLKAAYDELGSWPLAITAYQRVFGTSEPPILFSCARRVATIAGSRAFQGPVR